MASNFPNGNQAWLWLSVGVAACVVVGAILEIRRRSTQRNSRCKRDEIKEDFCDQDGATILKRLNGAEWNQATVEFLDGLIFEHVNEKKLRVFAGEQWYSIQKNIQSLEIVCERFSDAKDVVLFLNKILESNRASLRLLKPFGHDVLKVDLEKHVACVEAQSCAHSLCFITSRGSCAEMVGALAINIPVRNLVSKRLRNDLVKYGGYSKKQLAFLDFEGRSIPDFDELAERALNEALRLDGASWRKIESSVKILQESEKLFWDFVMREMTGPEVSRRMQRVSFWESFKLNGAPRVVDVPLDFDIPKIKKLKRSGTVKNIRTKSRSQFVTKRKKSAPMIPSRFSQMNDSQDMKKIPRNVTEQHVRGLKGASLPIASQSKRSEVSDAIEITENPPKAKIVIGIEQSVSAEQKVNEDYNIEEPSWERVEVDEECN